MLREDGLIRNAILIGNKEKIESNMESISLVGDAIEIIDLNDLKNERLLRQEYRKSRNLSILEDEMLNEAMTDPITIGALLLNLGKVDGFIGGLQTETAKILSTGINIVKANRRIGVVTSLCLIKTENQKIGENGFILITDSVVNPNPSVGVLCRISEAAAKFAREFLRIKPRIAFLSYSSKGSGIGKSVDKMRIAAVRSQKRMPEIEIDGELQLDAAIIPEIALIKAKESPLQGRANILIFPNLDSANIGSKFIQFFGNAKLIGPIILGLNKPFNDISRGADENDLYNLAIVTQLQVKK